jgi:hypothetical protein
MAYLTNDGSIYRQSPLQILPLPLVTDRYIIERFNAAGEKTSILWSTDAKSWHHDLAYYFQRQIYWQQYGERQNRWRHLLMVVILVISDGTSAR